MATTADASASSASALGSIVGVMSSAKEKWDASGANEAISRVTASIPQGTQDYLSTASSQLFNRKKVRSLTVTFGIGEERGFYIEKSPALVVARVKHNVSFFYLNYMLVTGFLFCLTLLIHPVDIIGIALLGALWMYVIRKTQSGFMTIYGMTISQTNATIGLIIFSICSLIWLLSHIFWWALFSSGFIVAVHAVFRDASMHQDGEDQVDMVGEVSGESAAFLGNKDVV